MPKITADKAAAGDVAAEPVVNDQGRTLLPKGARLSVAVFSRLEGWGGSELTIEVVAKEISNTDADAGLLDELEHRFLVSETDATMMHIKQIARRHLLTVRKG